MFYKDPYSERVVVHALGGPAPADGGRDEDPAQRVSEPEDWQPVITRPDPMTDAVPI